MSITKIDPPEFWLKESKTHGTFIFKAFEKESCKDDRFINSNYYIRGTVISCLPESKIIISGEVFPPDEFCRKLEDWEVIKYKLQGIICPPKN